MGKGEKSKRGSLHSSLVYLAGGQIGRLVENNQIDALLGARFVQSVNHFISLGSMFCNKQSGRPSCKKATILLTLKLFISG